MRITQAAPAAVLVAITMIGADELRACGKDMVLTPSSTSGVEARMAYDDECAPIQSGQHLGTFTRHQAPVKERTSPCMGVMRDPQPASPGEEYVLITNLTGSTFQSYYSANGLDGWVDGPVVPLAPVKGASCPDPHFVDGELHVYFEGNEKGNDFRFFRVVRNVFGAWGAPEGVLKKGTSGWNKVRRSPSVIRRDVADGNPSKYLLAYWAYESANPSHVNDATLGVARSADGTNFQVYPNPIVTNGPVGEWNRALTRPRLIADPDDPDTVHLVYAGFNRPIGRCSRIGYACSHDGGRNWNHLIDPVFNYGEPGDWDYEVNDQPLAYVPAITTAGAGDQDVRLYYSANYDPPPTDPDWTMAIGAATSPWTVFQQLCPDGARSGHTQAVTPPVLGLRLAPNPASREASLVFELDAPEAVTVALYDPAGRQVSVLAERRYLAGEHRVTIPRTNLVAGVYSVVVSAGDVTERARFIFVE